MNVGQSCKRHYQCWWLLLKAYYVCALTNMFSQLSPCHSHKSWTPHHYMLLTFFEMFQLLILLWTMQNLYSPVKIAQVLLEAWPCSRRSITYPINFFTYRYNFRTLSSVPYLNSYFKSNTFIFFLLKFLNQFVLFALLLCMF